MTAKHGSLMKAQNPDGLGPERVPPFRLVVKGRTQEVKSTSTIGLTSLMDGCG